MADRAVVRLRGWVLMALLAGCWTTAAAQAAGDEAALRRDGEARLRRELEAVVKAHHGRVALFARQVNSGREVGLDAGVEVQTASVIKLAILYEAMERVRAGKAKWEEKLTIEPGEPVGGSGVVRFLDTPMTLTLKDVLTLMIELSDNTATNVAIDRLGVEAINARIEGLGLRHTYLYKKIMKPATGPMPADQARFGLGKTTAEEMAALMERIGRCRLAEQGEASAADREICAVGMKMLRNQFYQDAIPRYLAKMDVTKEGSGIANKTGSLDAVRADVAIVAGTTGPIVLSIFTYENADKGWTVENEGEITIAKLAKAIVEAWSPDGIDGKTLVPGLGLDSVAGTGIVASH